MKKLLLLVLLLTAGIGFAQNFEKDTIQLKEVFIGSTPPKNSKTVKKRYSGFCNFYNSLGSYAEMVMLVDGLTEGYINSVEFNFNHKFSTRNKNYKFSDTDLLLVFYEVNADGTPGAMMGEPLPFTVNGDFKGKMEIAVPYPLVKNPGSFFLGLRRVNPIKQNDILDFEVNCLCTQEGDKYVAYSRYAASGGWDKMTFMPVVYKVTIKETVLVTKNINQ